MVAVWMTVLGASVTVWSFVMVAVWTTVPGASVTVLVVAAHVPGAAVTVTVAVVPGRTVVPGPAGVSGGIPPPHRPKTELHPSPQYSVVLPQYPASEQQSPYTDPRQVYPFPQTPSLPSGLGIRLEVGTATGGSELVGRIVVVGAAAGLSLTQYVVDGVRAQVPRVGFNWMNCETVRP